MWKFICALVIGTFAVLFAAEGVAPRPIEVAGAGRIAPINPPTSVSTTLTKIMVGEDGSMWIEEITVETTLKPNETRDEWLKRHDDKVIDLLIDGWKIRK